MNAKNPSENTAPLGRIGRYLEALPPPVKAKEGGKKTEALLRGFSLLVHFLLDAEADCICSAPLYKRSESRVNRRSGLHLRKLRTHLGVIFLQIVHFKYLHPRVSIVKRAKRLSASILETLARMYGTGVTVDDTVSLIKALWTIDLSDDLLNELTERLVPLLKAWRHTSKTRGGPAKNASQNAEKSE